MIDRVRNDRGNRYLRTADRVVGIPLVAAAGVVRRRRALPNAIRRIAVLNSTNIGDTVLLSAVLRDLAAALPEARIVLFVAARNERIAGMIDGVRVASISLSRPLAAIRAVRSEAPDVVLDFDPWPRIEAIYSLCSGARFTVGFRTAGQHRHYCYDATAEHSPALHELENYRRIVEPLGVVSTSTPILQPRALVCEDRVPQSPYVVLHLWPSGHRSELKEWPLERWHALAEEVARRGFTVVLTGSPADRERSAAFARSLDGAAVDAAGRFHLDELVDVVASSACVVSVNTGVMHVAAAAGARVIALNGPTSEHRWGPVGPRAVSVNSAFPGCGYLHLGWEYRGNRRDCMDGIALTAVVEAFEGLTAPKSAVL